MDTRSLRSYLRAEDCKRGWQLCWPACIMGDAGSLGPGLRMNTEGPGKPSVSERCGLKVGLLECEELEEGNEKEKEMSIGGINAFGG